MSASQGEDRSRLDGFELETFKLDEATSDQWRERLRAPLEHAAAEGNTDLFMRLLDAGADGIAGWRDCGGRTLLDAAAHGKNEDIERTVLKAGVREDVNVCFGERRESALHVAVVQGADNISGKLLIAGADPNLLDGAGQSRFTSLLAEDITELSDSSSKEPTHMERCRDGCTILLSMLQP
ncbi:unnamed protein product [Ectocarpus sp. CCAP 1310/34]|nr:unnamed protein product [Ectocarpus sp. CCAP 1310/34]